MSYTLYDSYEHFNLNSCFIILDICIDKKNEIPREVDDSVMEKIVTDLVKDADKSKVVVMFVNEDNCRRILQTTIRLGHAGALYWLASDSWGAKVHPVENNEWAAEGTVTILPQTNVLSGKFPFGLLVTAGEINLG